jgi:TraU protein
MRSAAMFWSRLTLVLVFLWPCAARAERVEIWWDYPLALQAGTSYTLRIITARHGQTQTSQQTLTALPAAACLKDDPGTTRPETRCALVCLDVGDYTLTVFARLSGTQSPDAQPPVDVTVTAPCVPPVAPLPPPVVAQPPAPAKRPPPVPLPPLVLPYPSPPPPDLVRLPNPGCVDWKIAGACLCGFPPHPCVSVEYWEPGWIVETVKRPGTTTLTVAKPLLDVVFGAGPALVGAGGAANAGNGGHTNLHFNEAHVLTFPQILGGPCTSCAPTTIPLAVHYVSEIDPLWRTAVAVPAPLSILEQIGVWAPLYPRGGKAIHGSEIVASGIAAVRAMNIAFNPVGTPPNVEVRVIQQPVTTLATCCQLSWPTPSPCFPPGVPPFLFETGKLNIRGEYIWTFWRKRVCCVEAAQATCGITLPGVGQHGQNTCVIPSPPSP